MSPSGRADSIWAPLRVGIFRALWLAVLVSNIGIWMQTVGAQWLLVNQPHASILVALVQTADMLPDVSGLSSTREISTAVWRSTGPNRIWYSIPTRRRDLCS